MCAFVGRFYGRANHAPLHASSNQPGRASVAHIMNAKIIYPHTAAGGSKGSLDIFYPATVFAAKYSKAIRAVLSPPAA
jgi:hypothetical protein